MENETRNLIRKFCGKLTIEYPDDEFNAEKDIFPMIGYVPDDIDIDRSKGDSFVLYGEYYKLYLEILKKLRSELATEYLKDGELKDAFWHFTCEIIAGYSVYRNSDKRKEKIDNFLYTISKPLEEYEILIPILYLDAKDLEIKIGDVIIKKFDEIALEDWGISKDIRVFKEIVNKTIATIPEKGNNPKLVCDRARRKADFVIRILQVSFSTNPSIRDEETLFKQDENIFYRKKDTPSSVGGEWQRSYKPIPVNIDEDLKKSIDKFLSSISEILEEEKLTPKLRECFEWALIWIGRSIEEEDPDIKIINLSTALEAILTTISDKKKGETLAYRMLLLNTYVDKSFIDPAEVLWIYEMRSKIVHGGAIGIASDKEYYAMRLVAIDTLHNSLEIICKKNLKKHTKFIETIESCDKREKIRDWLKKQGDERSLEIRKQMEQNR